MTSGRGIRRMRKTRRKPKRKKTTTGQIVSATYLCQSLPVVVSQEKMTEKKVPTTKFRKKTKEESLTPNEKTELLVRIATYQSNEEIIKWVNSLGKSLSDSGVDWYRYYNKDYQPLIRKFREEWEAGFLDIPISSKRNRLFRYERLFQEAYDSGQLREAAQILRNVKDEIEVDGPRVTMNFVQYNNLSDEELEEKRLKVINDIMKLKRLKTVTVGEESEK